MSWNLDDNIPIYLQLVEKIQKDIVSGFYKPGDKLPSVRELATTASVNPNTMQKAFADLERSGLIITQRTAGRTVTDDTELINLVRQKLAQKQILDFFKNMKALGFKNADIVTFVKKEIEEENNL